VCYLIRADQVLIRRKNERNLQIFRDHLAEQLGSEDLDEPLKEGEESIVSSEKGTIDEELAFHKKKLQPPPPRRLTRSSYSSSSSILNPSTPRSQYLMSTRSRTTLLSDDGGRSISTPSPSPVLDLTAYRFGKNKFTSSSPVTPIPTPSPVNTTFGFSSSSSLVKSMESPFSSSSSSKKKKKNIQDSILEETGGDQEEESQVEESSKKKKVVVTKPRRSSRNKQPQEKKILGIKYCFYNLKTQLN